MNACKETSVKNELPPSTATEPSAATAPTVRKNSAASAPAATGPSSRPLPDVENDIASPPLADVSAARAQRTRRRLQTSVAGRLLLKSIERHGGLTKWYSLGTADFDFDYVPVGKPKKRKYTRQQVDLWNSRARHTELGEGADATFAYDGKKAWMSPSADAFPSTARFWSLTPYYFVAMPFVLADEGVNLEKLPDVTIDGKAFDVIKATYNKGTGDADGDYYILHLDKQDGRVDALRYIVSYSGFFKDGGHSPEKFMRFENLRKESPHLAQSLNTFAWDPKTNTVKAKATDITVSYLKFGETYPADWLKAPANALIEKNP